jgi:hypothetical protein
LEPSFEAEHEPSFKAALPTSLTLDASGDLYMVTARYFGAAGTEEPDQVLQFDPSGKCVDCGINGEGGKPGFDRTTESQLYDIAAGGACGSNDVYVAHFNPATHGPSSERSFFSVWGSPPDLAVCPQPVHAPEVRAQFAVSVESGSASLRAQIGPRFWPDTSYHLEYGRQPCSLGGCQSTGSLALTSQVTSAVLTTPSVLLEGLSPGTTYYYRFVATSGGGGPVYGVDPDGSGPGEASFAAGVEGSFRTYRPAGVVSCSTNEAFRVGPSSLLPDCRAFELVSPLDKENGDIAVLVSSPNLLPSVLEQASVDGGKLAYGSYRSFGGAPSAPYTSQYVAVRRDGEGWASHPVSPPRGKAISTIGVQTRPEFRAFSPDLCEAWSWRTAEPPLAASAPTGNVDLYRHRDGECGGSGYVPLNTTSATVGLDLELQGRSADGSTAIFTADRPLEKGASTGQTQLYGVRAGVEQFLCVLPGGSAYAGSCSAGWSFERNFNGEENELAGALSNDGNRVFWTAAWGGAGKIYLRENPFAKASKECSGEAAQCTLEVSKAAEALAGTKGSQFWAAARDGSKAIFTTGPAAGESDLYEYRVADQSTHPIAGKVHGLMGVSSDGSRVYFASREALGGVNGEGKTAVAGEENLYMYEAGEAAGSFRFIGVLSGQDLVRPSPIEADLSRHDAQVSGDGLSAVFESYARLTGYDNTDRNSGQRDAELFVYDARGNEGKGRLVCASCNPGGARPAGAEYIRFHAAGEHGPWTAARIPVSEDVLYASRVLSDNGKRVFFDAYDSLTPRDGNGREDVYEWEAPGEGTCTEAASSYSPVNGGCVELVSSGQSRIDSEFVDATPSGNDVFFATLSSLLAQDYGLMDIYDARVDGGLPAPVVVGAGCEGEACQSPTVPPASSAFGSLTFSGEGNLLVSPVVSVKPKALTRAQRLAQALKRCRRMHVKHRRVACERGARKRLGAKQARVKRRRASRREG